MNSASPRSAIGSPVDGGVEEGGDENDAAAVDMVTAALASASRKGPETGKMRGEHA